MGVYRDMWICKYVLGFIGFGDVTPIMERISQSALMKTEVITSKSYLFCSQRR